MKTLLALLLAGCATIPDDAVVMLPADLARIEATYRALAAEIIRLRLSKVPMCREADYRG